MAEKNRDDVVAERRRQQEAKRAAELREKAAAKNRRFWSQAYMVAAVVGAIVVALTVLSSTVIIQTGNVGVRMEFGQMKDVLYPGLHFVVPVITSVQRMSVQTMKYEVNASAASSDLQVVSTQVAVNYKLKDDESSVKYIFQQFWGAHESRLIAPLVQESVKANTAKFTANDLIQRREVVKAAITSTLTEKLARYGIEVQEVSITNFDFSAEFNKAIEAKVVVEQEKQQMELELEKKQIEVQKLVVEQNATATAAIIQAEADKRTNILRAEGQANATLTKAYADKQAIEMVQAVLSPVYVQYQYSQRWDGELPYFMGGDTGILLNMGMEQEPAEADYYPYAAEAG